MKIDRSKLKKSSSEVPGDCGWLIEKLRTCSDDELFSVLSSVDSWSYGKCELYHWTDVLDRFDTILDAAAKKEEDKWVLACDLPYNARTQDLVVWVLHFTTLLVEHSFSRHLYSSVEHLITLLSSSNMTIVLAVLNLLYMFSKRSPSYFSRSNFITRLAAAPRQALLSRLMHLAESWGGKENGFGLAQCCQDLPLSQYPESATTLHFEFYGEQHPTMETTNQSSSTPSNNRSGSNSVGSNNSIITIHIDNIQSINKSPSHIMEELMQVYKVPADKQMILFTHIRLAHSFASYQTRLQCVQARLQALSVLVYCNALQDNANTVLYSGLLDEFVDVLELSDTKLTEIKAATLRTLTSIIHLERMPNFPKLSTIMDVTGASSYHGFLPVLVRSCIATLTCAVPPVPNPFPAPLATALFSFLYHLASYEAGGEALVSCGMMEALLQVVNWRGNEPDHITFVTRAVRVIDLITNMDMHAFQTHGGLSAFIRRLEIEVEECRKEQPFVIQLPAPLAEAESNNGASGSVETPGPPAEEITTDASQTPADSVDTQAEASDSPMDTSEPVDNVELNLGASTSGTPSATRPDYSEAKTTHSCLPQRAALLKSMLNFLKKAIQEPGFSESMRHLMEGSLPSSLKHIISNAEYYGPSLFLLATDVVTVYVFGEPSLLSSLQDNGLTDVVLHALLIKDVPATREVLGSLPNVFSALCLNSRGLQAFVACKPFERLFKVLLSPDYLPAMRRRRSSDPMGDTASNLGNAMDELMRHQPSLKTQAMKAIVKLLEEVCLLGSDMHYICWKTPPKHEVSPAPTSRNTNDNSSDEEEDEEEEQTGGGATASGAREDVPPETENEKRPVPLVDYVLNVMKFVDAILSNNSTDDHCKEFVNQKGLVPLLGILGLPNLPIEFPVSQACQSVASVCKSILNLAHENGVLQRGLMCLNEKLEALAPLHEPLPAPGGSVLLRELASALNPAEATSSPQATPLLHTLAAVHAYIMMLVHVCRTGQTEIRQVSINQWGTELGLKVLNGLTQLYTSLVWESTVLLALCSDDALPAGCLFGKEDTDKLLPPDVKPEEGVRSDAVAMEVTEGEGSASTEAPVTPAEGSMTTTGPQQQNSASQHQMKLIKQLLSSASRLGKALAELFGLLVKLCVGSPLRQRRGQQVVPPLAAPSVSARAVAAALAKLLHAGLSWTPPPSSPLPKFRLTFLICSVRFTNPMLFDDKKMPYHLMLQYFASSQGLKAFFDTFYWAITGGQKIPPEDGLESGELPEGTGEFLDTWLFLLERLVNPKAMLDSPHALPAKSSQSGYVPFVPLKFLIHIQKIAFEAVMKLWNKKPLKNYGVRISESVLIILCYILKGETIIQEKVSKEKETTEPAEPGATPARPPDPEVNQQHLQALMDMGFARERCVDALTQAHTLEQATEFLLTSPLNDQSIGSGAVGGDMELSEEDQMLQAIAMSLGENVQGAGGQQGHHKKEGSKAGPSGQSLSELNDDEPLPKSVLDKFTDGVLDGCLNQLDMQPQMVYKVCELITTCVSRNGTQWRDKMLTKLIKQMSDQVADLTAVAGQSATHETLDKLCTSELAVKFAVRLHLVTLLFEEMKSGCAMVMETEGLVHGLTHLLTLTQTTMSAAPPRLISPPATTSSSASTTPTQQQQLPVSQASVLVGPTLPTTKDKEKDKEKEKEKEESGITPKWLSPALLLLDLYEKLSVATKRRSAVQKVCSHIWKWFDMSTLKWCAYTAGNNKTIDDAYWNGDSSVRIISGRRKYTIQFHSMVQVNEESGNRRPVMVTINEKVVAEHKKKLKHPEVPAQLQEKSPEEIKKDKEVEEDEENKNTESSNVASGEEKMECEETDQSSSSNNIPEVKVIEGFTPHHRDALVRSCVGFIKLGVDPDTLHALMRMCLRVTQTWEHAMVFAQLGGVRTLLSLTESSAFWGFNNLASLLMRHVMEEPQTLRHTMEKVVRSSASNSTVSGVKELHYLLRVLAPAACRDPEVFTDIAQQCLRIDLNMILKRSITGNSEDSILMKSVGGKTALLAGGSGTSNSVINVTGEPQQLIHDLLEALTSQCDEPSTTVEGQVGLATAGTVATVGTSATTTTTPTEDAIAGGEGAATGGARRHLHLSRSSSANDMVVQESDEQSPIDNDPNKLPGSDLRTAGATGADKNDDANKKKKPLISKSGICKLLAEFVRSYAGCAKLVTEYHYSAGTNEKITEDCSAMGYMLDHMVCGGAGADKDTAGYVRVLVAALAACNHAPEAQTILVTEVKGALSRATVLPESAEKHSRIQALVGLICTMMEACPAQLNQPPNFCFKQQPLGMNNMIRVMVRKGLVTDLARIPHSLDLSSPNMAATINAALKPLELVSRIVNQPSYTPMSANKKKHPQQGDQQQQGGTGTTNSEATRAQGDDNVEDTENTEHDISGAGESLEPTSDSHPNEDGTLVEGDEAGLEEILDQLLEDGRPTSTHDTVTATVTYVLEHDPPMDTDDTLHDSRMVTHSESQFLDEGEDGGNDERDHDNSSASSDSSEEREEDEAEEENEDEEDVEEEEEEEEGDDDDEEDEEEEEEEEEEGSVCDEGYEDLEEAFIQLPGTRETDDILLLPPYQQYIDTIDTFIFGDRVSLQATTHDDPTFMASTPNANPTSTNMIPTHPLFQNPREVPNTGSSRISGRPSRQRGVLRLLGPSHREVIQLASNLREPPQVWFSNQDVRLMPHDPDEYIDLQDHGSNMMNNTSSSASLANVPSAHSRWTEETRALEADSMYDAVTVVKPSLMAVLEKYRDIEQAEREKKKKEQEASKATSETAQSSQEQGGEASESSGSGTAGGETAATTATATTTTAAAAAAGGQEGPGQDASAMVTTASIAESIAESVLGTTSTATLTTSTTAPPSISGLLTLLSPVSPGGTASLPLQEPSVSSNPPSRVASLIPSAPATPQASSLPSSTTPTLPPLPSANFTTSIVTFPSLSLPSAPTVSPIPPVPPTLTTSDTEMVAALPQTPPPLPTSRDATDTPIMQEDAPMSVSPPAYPIASSPELFTGGRDGAQPSMTPVQPREAWEEERQGQQGTSMQQDAPQDGRVRAVARQDLIGEQPMETNGSSQVVSHGARREGMEAGPSGATGGVGEPRTQRSEFTSILGDIEIPEGVDPSFLAALPEEMREEVIAEQLRLQRIRQRATEGTRENSTPPVGEVNPEFLAALPLSIQEEVLTQQRLEQQRQQAARANPDDPMDPVSFLQALPSTLRQTILADLEDSQFAALPPDLAQEAQTLRRQREERARHVHEHMFRSSTSLSSILRNTARIGSRLMHSSNWSTNWNFRPSSSGSQHVSVSTKPRGRQLLDHEAMTCLLVLLFVDEPKLNTSRLHRVLRNLCHHTPTRDWVIKALLSIIERCGDPTQSCSRTSGSFQLATEILAPAGLCLTPDGGMGKGAISKKGSRGDVTPVMSSTPIWRSEARAPAPPSWLSMSMDAALGCRANIFQIQRSHYSGKRTSVNALSNTVHIHPQASPLVCRHALDTLISLAKSFPSHFLPHQAKSKENTEESNKSDSKKCATAATVVPSSGAVTKMPKGGSSQTLEGTDFWELLVKLDSISVSRKGKGLTRTHSGVGSSSEEDHRSLSLENSALGQLIMQLAHPVIKRSSLLTDRLLRLLALISLCLPETADSGQTTKASQEATSVLENLLSLAIQVLTSKSCSEEGLEDATALLLHLSHGPPPTRDLVLRLLLQGAAQLGSTVAQHIAALLEDLRAYNLQHRHIINDEEEQPMDHIPEKQFKGLLRDRFTNEQVIIRGSAKVKPPCELQLASMSALTSKTSSQAFFLRTLKVIIQLRDAIRLARNRRNRNQRSSESAGRTEQENQNRANSNQQEANVTEQQQDLSVASVTSAQSTTTTPSATQTTSINSLASTTTAATTISTTPATTSVTTPEAGQGSSMNVPNPEADNTANTASVESHIGYSEVVPPVTQEASQQAEAMDVDSEVAEPADLGSLSSQLALEHLWHTLSSCLVELGETPDHHAVLVLQPAVESFFLVHAAAGDRNDRAGGHSESREAQLAHLQHEIAPLSPLPSTALEGEGTTTEEATVQPDGTLLVTSIKTFISSDTQKFLTFAETHRTVLNQILRQSTVHLADGPFSVLVDHTRLLDFDIKRKYFRTELERADDGMRREDLAVHVRREHVFEDSFRELHRRSPDEWKNRFYIVFEGEEGQDAGGLLREWYMIISREIFNPNYALFCTSPGDRVTYMINPASHCNSNHLSYFKFVGRVIAKAIYDNKLLECYFTRSFYKHILGKMVRVQDMESEDYSFYQGLIYLIEHNVADLGYELTFSTEVQEFGVTEVRDLKPSGRNIPVTEETKMEYVRLVCQMKMTGAIRKQLNAFLEGFYDIIPKRLISIFNEQETELLISGLPTIDIDDLRTNTEYHKYQPNSLQIQWFWRALRSFDQAERAKFLQFVTGTSKVPLQGFAALEGMNGTQKFQIHRDDRSTDRLPSAHTCFNQLDLPVYETYDKLRHYLLKAIHECSEGFGFA
ncbi:HECT, UBA and WWE domain containing E3 ubiquitin protein ligase 1 isoform X2 [Oratosquilla oratoria]|uniref:HECT, UBA and WWE domain containing E3 ubiquitin protein ligase 1 isoform X2 n=1 Tax=Oratosquilla oratoria TaxID=337810 RepID=UPI003F776E88